MKKFLHQSLLFGVWLACCLGPASALALVAASTTFTNPIVASGADPWVIQHQQHYYFCQSRGGRGIWVNRSDRLEEIGNGPWVRVWSPPRGVAYSRELWAPELHYLRGSWFIYVAADDGDNNHHRMYVLEGTSQNPQDPFVLRGKLAAPGDRWAIDGTVLQIGEQLYFCWSGWDGDQNVAQNLYLAPMSDPLTICGERVCISRPDHGWEQVGRPLVNEGPEALWHDGKLFIIYSASGSWGDHYCLGQLAWTGGDVLRPESWVKKPVPVFSGSKEVISPGHCSFVKSPDGKEDWIVYHAAKYPGAGWSRNVRLQRFGWNSDGSPDFGTPVPPGVSAFVPSGETAAALPAGATNAAKFQNPINPGPDPWLDYYGGNYYLTTTQGDAIRMWKAPTLAGLKTAIPVTVWQDADPSRSRGMWAPEFHLITNRWYLYYTATSSDNNDDNHRLHVLESAGPDPLGPYTYKGRLVNPANDHYAIDASVFQNHADGSWYLVWAARPGHVLYIARLANPWTVAGKGVYLPADGFGCSEVREGPVALQHNGKVFLVYSACDTGKPDYKLGMLMADESSDLLDPRSWKQYPRPVFERNDAAGVFGPGHNGFFRSPDGAEDWIVYHGKTNSAYTYRGRSTRAQKFTWNADGTPNFGTPLPLSAILDEPSHRVTGAQN